MVPLRDSQWLLSLERCLVLNSSVPAASAFYLSRSAVSLLLAIRPGSPNSDRLRNLPAAFSVPEALPISTKYPPRVNPPRRTVCN
jgi:hypothetical protein